MKVTAQQIKNLWTDGAVIDRGDDYAPVTLDDFDGMDIDTDDAGTPTDDMWQVLADQVNSETEGKVAAGSTHADTLQQITEAADRIVQDEDDRDAMIRAAISDGIPVTAIANAAHLSRARIYQIRDRRR